MIETTVQSYSSTHHYERHLREMTAKGWNVVSVQEKRHISRQLPTDLVVTYQRDTATMPESERVPAGGGCPRCGAPIRATMYFCPRCHHQLRS